MAVLVEAAIRDQILLNGGYSASKDLVKKQADAMISNAQNMHTVKGKGNRPKSGTESRPGKEPQ
jgi:hypothetical protein